MMALWTWRSKLRRSKAVASYRTPKKGSLLRRLRTSEASDPAVM